MSSDKILKAVSNDFANRMRWWAQNRDASTVQSAWPSEGPGAGVKGPRFHRPRTPLMLGMVHDIELAIDALPGRYAQVVKQFWLFEGRSVRWHARHRQIDNHTFEIWVIKGHVLLRAEFAATSDRWHRQVAQARAELTPEQRAFVERIAADVVEADAVSHYSLDTLDSPKYHPFRY